MSDITRASFLGRMSAAVVAVATFDVGAFVVRSLPTLFAREDIDGLLIDDPDINPTTGMEFDREAPAYFDPDLWR